MNKTIQLHDTVLSAVAFKGGETVISLSTAIVHESSGIPLFDAGQGWSQAARLTFGNTEPAPVPPKLPASVSDGVLRIDGNIHQTFIPAEGHFEGAIEFSVTLSMSEDEPLGIWTIRGSQVTVQLEGKPAHVREYTGYNEA